MIAENLQSDPSPCAREHGPAMQVSEIAHDLKNCMSILLYLVETLGTDGQPLFSDDSLDDLKKLAHKMNSLVERLDSL
ncbi:MAG TPA: hypothetical protein VIE89_16530 [Candidatus Binatia bacterium]|jgi:hypothetical protein